MRAWALSAIFLLLSAGCSVGSADTAGSAAGAGGGSAGTNGGGSGGEAGTVAMPSSLTFETVEELVARQALTLRVRAKPAGVYHVRFTLPNTDGSAPLDAVLSASEADTATDGIAQVELIAPSNITTFQVRASTSEAAVATLTLEVKDTGFADLQVVPRYGSALRFPTTWIATAHPNASCSDLQGVPPPDGSFVSSPAGQSEAPLLPRLPANTPLAITLRSGHFVGGCASVSGLTPDAKQTVTVPVLNRPIDLGSSQLALKLDLATGDVAWSKLLGSAREAALGALGGASTDDVDALLDAMREAAGNDRQPFETARQAENWDALVRGRLGAGAASQLHAWVEGWFSRGIKSFAASARLLEGSVDPDSKTGEGAHLSVTAMAGVAAAKAGVASPAVWSWSAGPDDNVAMSTDVYFVESKLLAALAEPLAVAASTSADDAPGALVEAVDCESLANALVSAGPSASLAYDGCESGCVETLCQKALRSLWLRAAAATSLSPSRLTLTATSHAFVGDAAEIAGMNGTWIGQLVGPDGPASTGGPLTATSAP